MKRYVDNDTGEEPSKSPSLRAAFKKVSASLQEYPPTRPKSEMTGDPIEDILSPRTPMVNKPKSTRDFFTKEPSKSDYWSSKLNIHPAPPVLLLQSTNETSGSAMTPKVFNFITINAKTPRVNVWLKLESGLTTINPPITVSILQTLNKVSLERSSNGTNIDPISHRDMQGTGRRLFFIKEWEQHLHHILLSRASMDLGLPYQGANKQLIGIQLNEPIVPIQVNLNLSSDMETNLFILMDSASNQTQKDNLYSLLLLLFSVNFNCLRPQTGYIHIILKLPSFFHYDNNKVTFNGQHTKNTKCSTNKKTKDQLLTCLLFTFSNTNLYLPLNTTQN